MILPGLYVKLNSSNLKFKYEIIKLNKFKYESITKNYKINICE